MVLPWLQQCAAAELCGSAAHRQCKIECAGCDSLGSNFGKKTCPFSCAACAPFIRCTPLLEPTATVEPFSTGDGGDDCGSPAHRECINVCAACDPLGSNFGNKTCPFSCAACAPFIRCTPLLEPTATVEPFSTGDGGDDCGSPAHRECINVCAACDPLGSNIGTTACPFFCATCAGFIDCSPLPEPAPTEGPVLSDVVGSDDCGSAAHRYCLRNCPECDPLGGNVATEACPFVCTACVGFIECPTVPESSTTDEPGEQSSTKINKQACGSAMHRQCLIDCASCDPVGVNFNTSACPAAACANCVGFSKCTLPESATTTSEPPSLRPGSDDDETACGSTTHQQCIKDCAACNQTGSNNGTDECPLSCAICTPFQGCSPLPDERCSGFDLSTMKVHQIFPEIALQRAGIECVRVAESEYSTDVVHPVLQSPDPHLVRVNRPGTCRQLFPAKGPFSCNRGGMLIQRGDENSCLLGQSNCTKTTFAEMNYSLNPVVGAGSISDYGIPDCTSSRASRCDPYELTMVIFPTKCECERLADLIGSISISVLRPEAEWRSPKLGHWSVQTSFPLVLSVCPALGFTNPHTFPGK
jgi:hypothetical protein